MRIKLLFILWVAFTFSYGQKDERISTLDFVEILNGNTEETEFYYRNNWKKLRESALAKGYIHSFEVLETPATDEAPFHLILITTYSDKAAYDQREDRFAELIEKAGELKLMNDKKPSEFRKNLFNKGHVRHWETKPNL